MRGCGRTSGWRRASTPSAACSFWPGIVLGFINAWVIGWDLLASWLIAAYVLVVLIVIVGGAMGPYLRRVKAALAASDELDRDQVSDALEAQLSRPNVTIGSIILILLIVAIIHDMVFKPGT